jgi:hypothetical protein
MEILGFVIGWDTLGLAAVALVFWALPRVTKMTPWGWDDKVGEAAAAIAEEVGLDPAKVKDKVVGRLKRKVKK